MSIFQTIGLIARDGESRTATTLADLAAHLLAHGRTVLVEPGATAIPIGCEAGGREEMRRRCDLIIVIGGDGTFLNVARSLAAADAPLLGVNVGRLGFLVDISPQDMAERLDEILAGRFAESTRTLLHASVIRGGETVAESLAVNDVVLHAHGAVRMIEFDTWIDGRFVNCQRADGIIVATSTGSTAYALSAGGPLLDPSLDALVLVPVCPHTLSNRPIVVRGASRIEFVFSEGNHCAAQVAFDGQSMHELRPGDRIRIVASEHRLRLVHPAGHDHFSLLRTKLRWGEQP